jgi:hypothetical protein
MPLCSDAGYLVPHALKTTVGLACIDMPLCSDAGQQKQLYLTCNRSKLISEALETSSFYFAQRGLLRGALLRMTLLLLHSQQALVCNMRQ